MLRNVLSLRVLSLISVVRGPIIPAVRNPPVVINFPAERVDRCIWTVSVVLHSTIVNDAQSDALNQKQQPIRPAFFDK